MSYIGLALQLLACCCKLAEHYGKDNPENGAAPKKPSSSRVHPLDQETNGENPPTLGEDLTQPPDAGISFGGSYCAIHTCTGTNEVYCDSGCCTDDAVTRCCPNTMMVVAGTIFGTLLAVMVITATIVICLRRRHRKLHAFNKYMDKDTQTSSRPPRPDEDLTPQPSLPPDEIINL